VEAYYRELAFLMRYGNQPVSCLLGRAPTTFERKLLVEAVSWWLQQEAPKG
jgi:hypothetical protein